MFCKKAPNGLRYLRWGGGRRSRPTRKMVRRRKPLEIATEFPASGVVRFVGWRCYEQPHFMEIETLYSPELSPM